MAPTATVPATAWQLRVDRSQSDALVLHLEGQWTLESRLPRAAEVLNQATADGHTARVSFDSANLEAWDSGFIIFLRAFLAETSRSLITCDLSGLPEGVRRLLALTTAVPER